MSKFLLFEIWPHRCRRSPFRSDEINDCWNCARSFPNVVWGQFGPPTNQRLAEKRASSPYDAWFADRGGQLPPISLGSATGCRGLASGRPLCRPTRFGGGQPILVRLGAFRLPGTAIDATLRPSGKAGRGGSCCSLMELCRKYWVGEELLLSARPSFVLGLPSGYRIFSKGFWLMVGATVGDGGWRRGTVARPPPPKSIGHLLRKPGCEAAQLAS
jgi:hypothetical protein